MSHRVIQCEARFAPVRPFVTCCILSLLTHGLGCSKRGGYQGTITDWATTRPLPGVRVVAQASSNVKAFQPYLELTSTTNAHGTYVVRHVEPSLSYVLSISRQGYTSGTRRPERVPPKQTILVDPVALCPMPPRDGLWIHQNGKFEDVLDRVPAVKLITHRGSGGFTGTRSTFTVDPLDFHKAGLIPSSGEILLVAMGSATDGTLLCLKGTKVARLPEAVVWDSFKTREQRLWAKKIRATPGERFLFLAKAERGHFQSVLGGETLLKSGYMLTVVQRGTDLRQERAKACLALAKRAFEQRRLDTSRKYLQVATSFVQSAGAEELSRELAMQQGVCERLRAQFEEKATHLVQAMQVRSQLAQVNVEAKLPRLRNLGSWCVENTGKGSVGHGGYPMKLKMSEDGRYLGITCAEHTGGDNVYGIVVWDTREEKVVFSKLKFRSTRRGQSLLRYHAEDFAFSPDGSLVGVARGADFYVRGENKGWVELYGVDGSPRWSKELDVNPSSICFSPDGTKLVVGCSRGRTLLLDVASGSTLSQAPHDRQDNTYYQLVMSDDGDVLCARGFMDPEVYVLDAATLQVKHVCRVSPRNVDVETMAFLGQGLVAAGCDDGSIRVFDVKNGSEKQRVQVCPSGSVRSLAMYDDGTVSLLAAGVGGDKGGIKAFRLPDWSALLDQPGWRSRICLSRDGRYLYVVGTSGKKRTHVRIWRCGFSDPMAAPPLDISQAQTAPNGNDPLQSNTKWRGEFSQPGWGKCAMDMSIAERKGNAIVGTFYWNYEKIDTTTRFRGVIDGTAVLVEEHEVVKGKPDRVLIPGIYRGDISGDTITGTNRSDPHITWQLKLAE